ncbi:MAG: integrase domain-containing protein [Porticoccaceae bacterium]|nr:integrase domain-containing protein [Porticoccaceae bacterium]
MPKVTKPLTNTEINNARGKAKEYNLADGRGLALRVRPSGDKYWIFNYQRPISKVRANISLGIFPSVSLADARGRRAEYRELLTQNIDPKTQREQQSSLAADAAFNTLERVAKDWLSVKKSKVSDDHGDDIWRSLQLHIFPYIGKQPISSISAPMVIGALKPVEARGSFETVKRLCQRLNEIMVFAVNTGLIEGANPISGIKDAFIAPTKKHLPTLLPHQLNDLVRRIYGASIRLTTRNLLLWQLHTMVRPSEAAGTSWDEIDLEGRLWRIPPSRMKKKRQHVVPLSPEMIVILIEMQTISGRSRFVFPSEVKAQESMNAQSANMALKRMGYEGQLVSHGMRSLASTILNEHGFEPDIIESALAHTDKNNVRAAYNRAEYVERRRDMMDWWSKRVSQSGTSE